jgi:hypothetical protein
MCDIYDDATYFPFTGEYNPCWVPELLLLFRLSPFAMQMAPSPCPSPSHILETTTGWHSLQAGYQAHRSPQWKAVGDSNCLVL